jgi:hypothetical protein
MSKAAEGNLAGECTELSTRARDTNTPLIITRNTQ